MQLFLLLIPRNNSLMSALKKLGSDSFFMDIFSARLHFPPRNCLKTSLTVCLDEKEHQIFFISTLLSQALSQKICCAQLNVFYGFQSLDASSDILQNSWTTLVQGHERYLPALLRTCFSLIQKRHGVRTRMQGLKAETRSPN